MSIITDFQQAGENLINSIKQWVLPTPEWLLTPKAEEGLEKIGQLTEQKSFFQKTLAETNKAYADILPNSISQLTNGVIISAVVALAIILFILLRK